MTQLQKMKMMEDNRCTFCENFSEIIEHLLFDCVHVNIIWNMLRKWIKTKCKYYDITQYT